MHISRRFQCSFFSGLVFGLALFVSGSVDAAPFQGPGGDIAGCDGGVCDGPVSSASCGVCDMCRARGVQCGHRHRQKGRPCPKCNAWCELHVEPGTEERSCYQVDYKTICIPAIRFPWQKCGPVRCGRAKTIKVLKKHKYKCPTCHHEWKVVEPQPVCDLGCREPASSAENKPHSPSHVVWESFSDSERSVSPRGSGR